MLAMPLLLVQRCWDPPPGAALVFNCQMGRGRTTTGMVSIQRLVFITWLRTSLPACMLLHAFDSC